MKVRSESGSIMLEVVAVLALMGVMGAMLFRQVYQRNQELHNIQMASEIRTVKEAFSAYIQSNRASVSRGCIASDQAHYNAGEIITCDMGSSEIAREVCGYLPDGWFGEDNGPGLHGCGAVDGLAANYNFKMYAYKETNSERPVVYGLVGPTRQTIPSSGWNFRRAARIALLIGADGGAYDETITQGHINGSLGAWELPGNSDIIYCRGDADGCSIYVANTGLDIFSPEYTVEGKSNIKDPWNLAVRDLHAYNYFSVGGDTDCYEIGHTELDGRGDVQNDDIRNISWAGGSPCTPLFWVGSDRGVDPNNGNVYVVNDLNVGADTTGGGDHALKITKEGVIKQKKGLTIDPQGRIIAPEKVMTPEGHYGEVAGATTLGDLRSGEHYMLDLAHTSNMMDIRLASRGGVRLSDILPNYVLKEVYDVGCKVGDNTSVLQGLNSSNALVNSTSWCDAYKGNASATRTFIFPDCPTGYKQVVVVIPSFFGDGGITKKGHTHTVSGGTTGNAGYNANGDKFVSDVCQAFALVSFNKDQAGHPAGYAEETNQNNKQFFVTLGYRGKKGNKGSETSGGKERSYVCEGMTDSGVRHHATVQTYCVWAPSMLTHAECRLAGYKWDAGRCTSEHWMETEIGDITDASELSERACTFYGFTWDNTPKRQRCRFIYKSANDINNLSKNTVAGAYDRLPVEDDAAYLARKRAICIAAGHNWNGASCTAAH